MMHGMPNPPKLRKLLAINPLRVTEIEFCSLSGENSYRRKELGLKKRVKALICFNIIIIILVIADVHLCCSYWY